MAEAISEENLQRINLNDISIQAQPSGKNLLILICETREGSDKLHEIIHQNPFKLKASMDSDSAYMLTFEFTNSEFGFVFKTGKTATDYPPIAELSNNNIQFITTGIWSSKKYEGKRMCKYHQQFLRLGEINIGHSLQNAIEIHFVPGRSSNEPSVVILAFQDFDDISKAEADEAFSKLTEFSTGNPKMEIIENNATTDVRIWDILTDLNIKVEGLKHNPIQLKQFLEKTNPKQSFALALGLMPKHGELASLTSKNGSPQIITIKGYTYKPSSITS